jgi:hypothetical protein
MRPDCFSPSKFPSGNLTGLKGFRETCRSGVTLVPPSFLAAEDVAPVQGVKECILHFGIVHELNLLRLLYYLTNIKINNW